MKILILGGNGMLGPWVIKALNGRHEITVTDINDPPGNFNHKFIKLSADDLDGVVEASDGMDCIVNLSVLREDRKLAFDVSTRGNYNMMVAAKTHGIRRIINTGPQSQMIGPQYEWDHNLNPDMPPAPGTRLYEITKALGQEICRVFAERHDIYVLTLLYYNMRHTWNFGPGQDDTVYHNDMTPYTTLWPDCGTAIQKAIEVPEIKLASRSETFFVLPDIPHAKYDAKKIKTILGWEPRYHGEVLWNKSPRKPVSQSHGAFD